MTTNFRFVTDKDFTEERFARVCVKMHDAMKLYKQTETIYNFLLTHKGSEFTPTQIGLALGKPFAVQYWDGDVNACTKMISDSLYWLLELGLIIRYTHTEKVEVELGYKERVRDVKIIDGVEYVGYIYKDTIEVEHKSYTWSAL